MNRYTYYKKIYIKLVMSTNQDEEIIVYDDYKISLYKLLIKC
jgi:hypothetical protein